MNLVINLHIPNKGRSNTKFKFYGMNKAKCLNLVKVIHRIMSELEMNSFDLEIGLDEASPIEDEKESEEDKKNMITEDNQS